MGAPAKAKRRLRSLAELAPLCPVCLQAAQLVTGADIYRGSPELASKPYWRCEPCQTWCGCHAGTNKPLGIPADKATRDARQHVHKDVLDPLWQGAINALGYEPEDEKARAIIRNVARKRVYEYLANRMGLTRAETHTGLFSIEQCRQAYRILRDVDYPEIRAWAKSQPKKETPCTPSSPLT